jgi:hypothetical protein
MPTKSLLRFYLLAFAGWLSAAPAFGGEQSHAIPWAGLSAKDCNIIVDHSEIEAVILLRCKGRIDVVVDVIQERGK